MVDDEKSDIREVIPMDELTEDEERDMQKNESESVESGLVTPKELERNLRKLRGKLPSFIIKDLRDNLLGKELTKNKLNKIINKVINAYQMSLGIDEGLSKTIDSINQRLEKLASEIDSLKDGSKDMLATNQGKRKNGSSSPDSSLEKNKVDMEELLSPQDVGGNGVLLKEIPKDPVSIMLTIKWLEFIVDKAGTNNLPDVLEFYCDMGWISDDVLTKLLKYAKGIKPFFMDDDWKPEEKLSAKDHLLSLMFLERIKGNRVSRDLLIRLDRELRRIRTSAEEIYGV